MTSVYFFLGLAGLFLGGHWLVQGATGLAQAFRVPPLVIGLTIVGFGTSTPELLVSIDAAWRGFGGIAIGNVLGSNIGNVLLILGISALLGAIHAEFGKLKPDLLWMMGAALICVPMFWGGWLGRIEGLILSAGIAVYILAALRQAGSAAPSDVPPPPLQISGAYITVGLVLLMVGARLLVDSATDIARAFGISEAVIGLTIVAIGTSLPELATSLIAAWKGAREIALGNVIGSNIYNILGILGLSALIAPIPVAPRFLMIDVPVMIAVSLLLVGLIAWRHEISRRAGAAFLALYAVYVAAMAVI